MRRALLRSTLAAFVCLAAGMAVAAEPGAPGTLSTTKAKPVPAASSQPTAAASLFAKPVSLRGTLGNKQVQMNLRPKPGDEGIEGDYFAFGSSQKILVAGEVEADELFLEESENGTDVSGQWEGQLSGGVLKGIWLSADGSTTKPFSLKVTPVDQKATRQPAKPASATPVKQANP